MITPNHISDIHITRQLDNARQEEYVGPKVHQDLIGRRACDRSRRRRTRLNRLDIESEMHVVRVADFARIANDRNFQRLIFARARTAWTDENGRLGRL